MKQISTIIGTAMCLIFAIHNQSLAQMKVGLIAGPNFNDIRGSDVKSEGMSIGYHLGAFVNFGKTLMIEPQVLYSVKGAQLTKGNLNLNYMEIPVWVRYQLDNGFNFNAGPYAAVLLNAKSDGEDANEKFTTADVGLGFGIGYQFSSGIGFAANYSQGLSTIGEEYVSFGQKVEYDSKTACIKLSASYTFGGRRD